MTTAQSVTVALLLALTAAACDDAGAEDGGPPTGTDAAVDGGARDGGADAGEARDAGGGVDLDGGADASVTPLDGGLDCASPDRDLRACLLASPDRVGFGAATTGGTDYVYVTTFDEFRAAAATDGAFVVIDPSAAGQTWRITGTVRVAANVTLYGALAPGHRFVQGATRTGFVSRQGNNIYHGLRIEGRPPDTMARTAVMLRTGADYWVDHLEILDYRDDALAIGQLDMGLDSADRITVSNYWPHDTSKSLLVDADSREQRVAHVTVLRSMLHGEDRSVRNSGGIVHVFNCWVRSRLGVNGAYASAVHADAVLGGLTLAEGLVYDADLQRNPAISERGDLPGGGARIQTTGHMFTDGSSIYRGGPPGTVSPGGYQTGSVNPTGVAPPTIPYRYRLMATDSVEAYVRANAGAF